MDWRGLFLTSQGRIGRKDFWIGFLILFVAGLVLGVIPLLGFVISLALIYPNVCIVAKRLHDAGRSGWLAAVPYGAGLLYGVLAGVVGGAALFTAAAGGAMTDAGALGALGMVGVLGFVLVLFLLGFLLWVGLSKGDPGPNRYGPPPMSMITAV